jgi:Ca2+-binding EF-hand superfamily protein
MDAHELRIVMRALGFQPGKHETEMMFADYFGKPYEKQDSADVALNAEEEDSDSSSSSEKIEAKKDESKASGSNDDPPKSSADDLNGLLNDMKRSDSDSESEDEDTLSMDQFIEMMSYKMVSCYLFSGERLD